MEWEYEEINSNQIEEISAKCGISIEMAQILYKRGLKDKKEILEFINPDISMLRDPFGFEHMKSAVELILQKKSKGEKVYIYGDYDVDGITAAAFMTIVLRNCGIDTGYYIPNRMQDGYGLNKKAIDYIRQNGGKLIITVDVGVNSSEEIKYAKDNGISIIVTDHHKLLQEPEEDILMINPKLSGNYGFSALSGAGVALKLAEALYITQGISLEKVYDYMDIVMLGTVADVVPMLDENRIIIKNGLEKLKETKIKGLNYIIRYLKINKSTLDTTDVSFFIAPMLNALGRTGDSTIGVDFFMEEDEFVIYNIIEEMKKANKIRRSIERLIFNEITENLGEKLLNLDYIFLKSEKWHPGVIGVVAARLALKYNVPVFLISLNGKTGKASCRSTDGINIFDMLKVISHKFIRFGGHDLAAGFVAKEEDLKFIESAIANMLPEKLKKSVEKEIEIDLKLSPINIEKKFIKEMEILAPFGISNSQPLFYTEEVKFEYIKKFGVDNRHFKAFMVKDGVTYSSVGFNLGHKIGDTCFNKKYDVVYYPERVEHKGEEFIQLKIKDFKDKSL